MTPGRKAATGDARRVDADLPGAAAHQPHRALCIGERPVGAVFPAVAGQAIDEDLGGDAASREPARQVLALSAHHEVALDPPGRESTGGPNWVGGTDMEQP